MSCHPHPNFVVLLRQCTSLHHIKSLHAYLLISSSLTSFLSSALIAAYSRLNLLPSALSVFSQSPPPHSSLLFNSILRASLSHSLPHLTLSLYRRLSAPPDSFTLPLILRACSALASPSLCVALHAHSITSGHHTHLHVTNELILSYSKIGRMDIALKLFGTMHHRAIVSWNTLISGYSLNRQWKLAYAVFRQMECDGTVPNPVTWTALLSAHARCGQWCDVVALFEELRGRGCGCTAEAVAVVLSVVAYTGGGALGRGMKLHGYVVRIGFEWYPFVRNSLVGVYGKVGEREGAERLFSEMEVKDLVSWNALISSYAAGGLCDEAYEVLTQMGSVGLVPNVVSWSAVMGGFASAGRVDRALEIFRWMQKAGVPPNSITIATILSACAEISALRSGREIHARAIRGLMDGSILVGNGLVNMYTKSGSLQVGRSVFDRIGMKDLISWNSIIAGYGMHGLCDEALSTFDDLIRAGFEPDRISFLAVLSACSHVGRVAEGRCLFDQMIHEYKLIPSMEHYTCMVDLLGRAGLLHEASELMRRMPMKPNTCVWGALLNSCRIHRNAAIAEDILRGIGDLEEQSTGNYILLSNLYAACGRWDDSAGVRVLTKARGLKKNPGQSWIEMKENMYVFSAGSTLPDGTEDVYEVLEDLNIHMESEKYLHEDCIMMDNYNVIEVPGIHCHSVLGEACKCCCSDQLKGFCETA